MKNLFFILLTSSFFSCRPSTNSPYGVILKEGSAITLVDSNHIIIDDSKVNYTFTNKHFLPINAYFFSCDSEVETEESLGTEVEVDTGVRGAKDYCAVIKKVKKDNITLENIGEIMLCQIPGVSSVSAIAILREFKTLPELIKAIQQESTCLNGISTTDSKGKTRKISKTTIETIVKYLS